MKEKILLGVVIINIIFIGIYLAVKPATVEAKNTKAAPAQVQQKKQQQQPQQIAADPGDQIEMIRQREDQVKAREMELSELEKQVTEKIKKLEAIEASLKVELDAYKVVAGERVKQLVKIYSTMKPKAAATLMNNLDLEIAVQVVLGMKGDIAGGILTYMEPQKAAAISQRLMTFRTGIGPAPAAPAEKESATQKTSENAPSSPPAVSYQDVEPPAMEKTHPAAKRPILAKRAVQPKQTIASVKSSPAGTPVSAPAPVIAATPEPAPTVPVSTPTNVSTPAPASIPASAPTLASVPPAKDQPTE
jgi:flagellar motility protein MotE (MotC chaperone)